LKALTLFEEKLSVFQDKSFVVCREIFSAGTRSAYKLKVSTCKLFYEMGEVRTWPAAEIRTIKSRQKQGSYAIKLPRKLPCWDRRYFIQV